MFVVMCKCVYVSFSTLCACARELLVWELCRMRAWIKLAQQIKDDSQKKTDEEEAAFF